MTKQAVKVQKTSETQWDVYTKQGEYASITAITSYNMGEHKPDGYRIDFNGRSLLRETWQAARGVATRLVRGEEVKRNC